MLKWWFVLTQSVDLPTSYPAPQHKNPFLFRNFLLSTSSSSPIVTRSQGIPFCVLGASHSSHLLLHGYQHSEYSTMHLVDFVVFMTLVTPLALAGLRGTLFQAHQLIPVPLSFLYIPSRLLTTGIENTFFRRTGDGMSPSFLTCCCLLRTLLTHFGLFSVQKILFNRLLQPILPLLVPQFHSNPC